MFGRKPTHKLTPLVVAPAPKLVKQEFCADEEYKLLSTKLGLALSLTTPIYPLDDAVKYLDSKFPPSKSGAKGWVWVPLRWRDVILGRSFNDVNNRTYTKPIPLAVLHTIDEIQTKYKDAARFFISDERQLTDSKEDPFLMVTLDDGRTLNVVERWDEPSFRVK